MRQRCGHIFVLLFIASGTVSAQSDMVLHGIVRDPSGAVVRGAEIQVLAPQQRFVGAARSDEQGRFAITVGQPGSYMVELRAAGFGDVRTAINVPLPNGQSLELTTGSPSIHEEVSVTASVDQIESTTRLTQPVNVIDERDLQMRAKSVVAQVANEEVGLHLQRTSPVMAGVFVRGLTGNKVNVFVDGVRYSTGAQRGGARTVLDFIDPALLGAGQGLRGPDNAPHRSDAP